MERLDCQEILFCRVVKNDEPFLGFIKAEAPQQFGLLLSQRFAKKNFFRE